MAKDILTPQEVWEDFPFDEIPQAELIDEKTIDGIVINRIRIDGKNTPSGRTGIFCLVARKQSLSALPCIVAVSPLDKEPSESFAIKLAEQGYMAAIVDVGGRVTENGYYTKYPEDISYAVYSGEENLVFSDNGNVKSTCFYEWSYSYFCAVKYFRSQSSVTAVCGIGYGENATCIWHASSVSGFLDCAVAVENAGWRVYRNILKYSGELDPQFSDETLKFLAGIEPQSYAKSVTCPFLFLTATNDRRYDFDRAFDTVGRIGDSIYKAVYYSPNFFSVNDENAYEDMLKFFEAFLTGKNSLPKIPEVRAEADNGEFRILGEVDKRGLKRVKLFVSEGVVEPSLRAYRAYDVSVKGGEFAFTYRRCAKSHIVCAFATAYYAGGFAISSNLTVKKATEKTDKVLKVRNNVVFSGRDEGSESIFAGVMPDGSNEVFDTEGDCTVYKKSGPMDICGAYSKYGLTTFKINAPCDKPVDDAILIFDAYSEEDCEFAVTLTGEKGGEEKEFRTRVSVVGGKVWHNVRLEMQRFKTDEGVSLKSFEKVKRITFTAKGKYLINNVLWV